MIQHTPPQPQPQHMKVIWESIVKNSKMTKDEKDILYIGMLLGAECMNTLYGICDEKPELDYLPIINVIQEIHDYKEGDEIVERYDLKVDLHEG